MTKSLPCFMTQAFYSWKKYWTNKNICDKIIILQKRNIAASFGTVAILVIQKSLIRKHFTSWLQGNLQADMRFSC